MQEYIARIQALWDNRALQVWRLSGAAGFWETTATSMRESGAERVVELLWDCDNQEYRRTFPCDVLPDRTGIVLLNDWHLAVSPEGSPKP